MRHVGKLTRHNFDSEVLDSPGPVVVDFYASWCGPCRALAPAVERLAREHPEARVAKLNVDEAPEIAALYDIRSVPTLLRFDDGEPSAAMIGGVRYEHIAPLLGLDATAPAAAA